VLDSLENNSTLKDYPQFIVDLSFRQRAKAIIRNLRLKGSETVLDCGCGDGIYIAALKNRCAWIVGLDVSITGLQIAKRSAKDNVSLVLGDTQNLPFKAGSFDRVLCTEVLEHLQDDVKALTEIRRVLVGGGFLMLTVPRLNYPFLWDPLNKTLTNLLKVSPIRRGILRGAWADHQRLYTEYELEKKLHTAELHACMLEGLTHIFFPSHPLIWNFYCSLRRRSGILRPPRLFLWILNHMDTVDSCIKKIAGSTTILACACSSK